MIVVLRGPDADMTVRRQVRVAGVWINRDAMTLYGMPAYYYAASTRPLAQVTTEETRFRYQLGLHRHRARARKHPHALQSRTLPPRRHPQSRP